MDGYGIMDRLAWIRMRSGVLFLALLLFFAVVFYARRRRSGRLLLCIGLAALFCGNVIQLAIPFYSASYTLEGQLTMETDTPIGWYIGSLFHTIGMVVTVVGSGLVVFREKT